MCREEAAAIVGEPQALGAPPFVGTEDRSFGVVPILIEIDAPEFDIARQIVRNWFDAADRHARTLHGPRTWRERKYSTQLRLDWPVLRRACDRATL